MSDLGSESNREILPALGAYVVFTIDPLASVGPEILEDPEAVVACRQLVTKQYVGLIVDRLELYLPWEPYNSSRVSFLLRGMPKESPEECIQSSMSLPILPMTLESHPSSREPLKPSRPLPWSDCYLSPFVFAEVRSPSLFTDDPVEWMLDDSDMSRFDRFTTRDMKRREHLKFTAAQNLSSASAPSDVKPISDAVSSSNCTASGPSRSPLPVNPKSSDSISFTTADAMDAEESDLIEGIFDYILSDRRSDQQMITVNFSHDLSTIEELNDPLEYFKEVDAIVRIMKAAWPRIEKARAQAAKAAEELNAATYDDRTVDLLVSRTASGRLSRLASKIQRIGRNVVQRITRLVRPGQIRR